MRISTAAVVLMLCPLAVDPGQATEAPKADKSGSKLKKGWVGLPFDPPVAKQIEPIVPPKKASKSRRRKRSRKRRKRK